MLNLDDLDLNDLVPFPDDSAPCPLAPLRCSEKFSKIISYFRRIIDNEEVSERAFIITQAVIETSGSFYQAWHYRRHLFERLQKDVREELSFVSRIGLENPKNYQMWSYRKVLLGLTQDFRAEFEFLDQVLQEDERNVHAWGFRLWATERFDLWHNQLEFVETFIENNPRNNSAWHFRHNIISRLEVSKEQNLNFIFRFVSDLLNESCFEYLKNICDFDHSLQIKRKIVSVAKDEGICVGVLKVLQKCFELEGKGKLSSWCFKKLMEIDEIRKEYWEDRMQQLNESQKELDDVDIELCEYFSIS